MTETPPERVCFPNLSGFLAAAPYGFRRFDGIPGEPEFSTVLHCTEGAAVMRNAVLKADCDEAVPIRFPRKGVFSGFFRFSRRCTAWISPFFDGIPGEPEFSTVPHGTNADHGD